MGRLLSFLASLSIVFLLSGCKEASVFDSTFDFEDIPVTSFMITYDKNGATSGDVPASSDHEEGTLVTVVGNTGSLALVGYDFLGWNTSSDGSGNSYVANDSFEIKENTVLYAQWEQQTFSVTYNGNGSTGGALPVDSNSPYAHNSTVTLMSEGTLIRTSHSFLGWNTSADGSGTNYSAGDTFTITADTNLYARWASSVSSLSGATLNIGGYAPAFASSTLSYSKSVSCEVGATNIRPTATDSNATIRVSINSSDDEAVNSGSASSALSLVGGQANVVKVVVTAADGVSSTTYNFTVNRAPTDMSCGIEAFWRLDEAPGATSVVDISGNNRNLKVTNVALGASGRTNSGASFGGGISHLYNVDLEELNIAHVTVSAWVYLNAYPTANPVPPNVDSRTDRISVAGFAQGSPASVYDKVIMITPNGHPQFYVYCDNSLAKFTSVPTPVISLNTWTHLVGVVDGINVYMYINGVRVANTTCGSTFASYTMSNLIIGGTTSRSLRHINGRIDEVGIWRRGFNDAEVLELYTSGY